MQKKAKTVSHSPLRPNPERVSIKNALDNPFKCKWPVLSESAIKQITQQLESSLNGMKVLFVRVNKTTRKRRKRAAVVSATTEAVGAEGEPPAKRRREEEQVSVAAEETESSLEGGHDDETATTDDVAGNNDNNSNTDNICVKDKRLQLVVGLNAVTRLLEQGRLQAGLLCTAAPKLLTQHLLLLAATRSVPFAALPRLSEVISQHLGIKRAICIGIKKPSGSQSAFKELVKVVISVAPAVTLPWLGLAEDACRSSGEAGKEGSKGAESVAIGSGDTAGGRTVLFSPLLVKRTEVLPNSKKLKSSSTS